MMCATAVCATGILGQYVIFRSTVLTIDCCPLTIDCCPLGFFVCCTSLLLYNVTPEWLASADDGAPAEVVLKGGTKAEMAR
jgi:hypothetical protein